MQALFPRCRDMICDIYACFIHYEKAFDTVIQEKLIDILAEIGIDEKDVRIIQNLYWNQTANIKVVGTNSESVTIQRGVRQGFVLSPMLFNLYSEMIFKEALIEVEQGIAVNGELLNNLRYADDTVIFSTSMEGLQQLLNSITSASERYDLKIKTGRLLLNNAEIERVVKFTYLGSLAN